MRLLIVDDERRYAELIARQLMAVEDPILDVGVAASGDEAVDCLSDGDYDLVITDLSMPGVSGIDLLGIIRRRWPTVRVALMTAYAEVDTAREALKRGAMDYLPKPVRLPALLDLVQQLLADRSGRFARQGARQGQKHFCDIVGRSPAMRSVFAAIESFAGSELPVLVLGESGTGKELVARAIHRLSSRRDRRLVDVHAGALAESIVERELFGHEQGAFTGADQRRPGLCESANGGSLFLDEIGEMPLSLQPKLLRFLQEQRFYRVGGTEPVLVDVRVIAATNRDLNAEVAAGRFRADLLYRLDVARIQVPPLRERANDIELLVDHFLRQHEQTFDRLQDDVLPLLEHYAWPGNVRELINVLERALLLAGDERIGRRHLPRELGGEVGSSSRLAAVDGDRLQLADNERRLILQALRRQKGNKAQAARQLGITRRRLYSRLEILGIDPSDPFAGE